MLPLFLLLASTFGVAKDATKLLPPHYREWLTKDVAYIINNEEKQSFLQLVSDADRDNFIERFWEVRNPTPGAPTNPYKTEHYIRLQYASDHFSLTGKEDGWRSDMGRVYITLGAPAQKGRYVTQSGVRGMEIWFYQNAHAALPPFFSIIFYEKDFGDFRLYSPYMDGPQKLVTGIQAEQGRQQAVLQIDHLLGREVAMTTLSLIPGEPVNLKDAESTMRSDMMLDTIRNLANHPFTIDQLRMRRALNESVTHRVVLPAELLNVVTVPLRDKQGNIRLHYAFRLTQPEDFAVAQTDQRFYYSLEVLVRVHGADGKEIISRNRKIAKYLTKQELEGIKGKPVAYEGWVPLVPGKYKFEFVFTNVLTKTAFTGDREITILQPEAGDFAITDPVAFSQAAVGDPARAEFQPFAVGGVRFQPYVGRELALVPGQDLQFFYQVWRPQVKGQSVTGQKMQADYAYGQPSVSGTAKLLHDELPLDQFDPYGSMVSGKKIETTDLGAGNYRLTISLSDPETRQKRFGTTSFHIVTENPSSSENWWIDDDGLEDYVASGQADSDRGQVYLANGDAQAATTFFMEALRKNPANERARARLIEQYSQKRDFAKVIELFAQQKVTTQTEEETILTVADSLDKTGNLKGAVDLLESAVTVKSPSGPLYLALASYYQHLGNNAKAEAFERKGRELMTENSGQTINK